MVPNRVHEGSLRLDQIEVSRLAWALGISLALHLIAFGSYELGKQLNIWQAFHLPAWLQKSKLFAVIPEKPAKPPVPQEVPLVFVDVSPDQAAADAPKNAKYYSSRNSVAANPEADKDIDIPKITGNQTQIVKAEDTPRSPYDKLMPDLTRAERDQEAERARASSPAPPGDLAMAKPDAALRPDNGTSEASRPRTIKEALMRQHRSQLVGEKMQQEGGVSRFRLDPGFDAKATPFGTYDAEFIEAVQSRWYDLLDNMSFDGYRRGRVMLQFNLNYDGRITEMKVLDNTVGEVLGLLCQKAVLDPAPFDKWPREMRLMVDKDYREIKFTFYYN
jgi:hypothetical protein